MDNRQSYSPIRWGIQKKKILIFICFINLKWKRTNSRKYQLWNTLLNVIEILNSSEKIWKNTIINIQIIAIIVGGKGYFTYSYDPSPAGVALSPGYMTEVEPCPECLEREICPQCGFLFGNLEEETCKNCGWNDKCQGEPQSPECWCSYEVEDDERLF